MAMLKDTVIAGSLRTTDSLLATTVQMQILNIPTTSNGTTFGPGTNGQILKSNGTSVYWASDNNSDTNVKQLAAITTAGAYPLILANSTATTEVTGTVNKASTLTYNPSTKALVTGGTVNGYTLAAACAKGVTDNSSNTDVTSSDTNLITGRTLYYQLAKKGYTTNTGTVTKVSTGVGLTGGDVTTTGTVKAKLRSETALTNDSAAATETSGRVYPVAVDKSGYLAVNVPWANDNTKNTTGTTNKTGTKMFLVAATEQSANPTTYSNSNCYIGTDNCLYSGGTKVLTAHQDISGKLNLSGGTLTGRLTTTKAINQIITGSGTAASDKGSGVSPRYFPVKWTFNTGLTATNGDIFTIEIPVAGHNYGVFMSIDNGTHYYPVVLNGTSRLTTHYPVNTQIMVMFDSSGSVASIVPLAGADASATVSGGVWRVLNYYDANNRDYGVRIYRQTSGYNDDYPLLVSRTLAASIGTSGTNDSSTNNIYGVLWNDATKTPTLNPSTGLMKVKDLKVNNIFNNYITGSGTAGTAGSSSVTYVPSKWTFNLGVATPEEGDTVTIKIPVAGVNSGVYMSTDNGTTYYPVAINYGASRLTTQFPVNSVITLVFQTDIATTVYPLAGGTATSSVNNGRWQVANFYDTNTTYSALSQSDANTGTATTARLITAAVLNTKITNRLHEVPTLSLTASKSSWSSSAPYTQTITATGVTASNSIVVGLGTSLTEAQYDAAADAKIICSAQATNSITLKCLGDKPTVDIPISVLVMT